MKIAPNAQNAAASIEDHVEYFLAVGRERCERKAFYEAELAFRKALDISPRHALAYNNLGWTLEMQNNADGALQHYQRALECDPDLRIARRNLAMLSLRLNRPQEAMRLCAAETRTDDDGLSWMQNLVSATMLSGDLELTGRFAAMLAAIRWGSRWYPGEAWAPDPPSQIPTPWLTIQKLQHDIEQFSYLMGHGVLGDEFEQIISDYQRVIDRLTPYGPTIRVELDVEAQRTIGHVFNRIVHIRNTPRVLRALSQRWDPGAVEQQYLNSPPGVVVVDDFLSAEALGEVRSFCLESTVWFANRYAHGRLGAFLHDGFNCPLLLQIAQELRQAMPRVIGNRYPLRQLWGFKNGANLPANSTTHADFAAVNVNFWITPTEANLDEDSGGLFVYGVDAPLHWDFITYNSRSDIIQPFLQQQQARAVKIPYRQNRAVIFNSDLFHGTAGVKFREGYENRRINITMLYGDREQDTQRVHHETHASAWRSAAFSRAR